jgi:hypothetical protein
LIVLKKTTTDFKKINGFRIGSSSKCNGFPEIPSARPADVASYVNKTLFHELDWK